MRRLSLAALALLLAAPVAAQTGVPRPTADPRADPSQPFGQTADQIRADPTGIDTRTVTDGEGNDAAVLENTTLDDPTGTAPRPAGGTAGRMAMPAMAAPDFSRLDRNVRTLGTDPNAARYSQERDAIRRDYDALGATPAMDARMAVMNRYEDLDATVGMSQMNLAPRSDYFRMADSRVSMYDRDIEASRMAFSSATGDARAERAAGLIGLRRQRDQYRSSVFEVRGAGASGFDAARRSAAPTLSRYDTDFRTARRSSMRSGQRMDGRMMNGQTGTQPMGTQPMNGTTGGTRN